MKKWTVRVAKATMGLILGLASLMALALWHGNRDVAPLSLSEKQQSFQRAVGWMRAHEAQILKEDNVALWWFVQAAAERTGDEYLQGLVLKYLAVASASEGPAGPWKRMLVPKAEVVLDIASTRWLAPYHKFFYHALTCVPLALDDGDTSVFLRNDVCHPQPTQVWLKDPVCTTHQLVGVMLLQRVGCARHEELAALEGDLLSDIHQQMQLDVVVKDAYFQRVLMLLWRGDREQVRPIWLNRVVMAQQADGGWVGGRQVPEWPHWAQPWVIRAQLARWWPLGFEAIGAEFHASAQGLLITALSLPPMPAKGQP
ncbi:hypothetical protein [Aquabacterium sp. CECT 9606]|uniref:hypothetical protein n=1 Tax=Aquabacterium sp. CECT 9606 TaxID=2845822 RepID=UPI001E5C0263|nr:hypothetical protein [Aquabacterium sp. CECT 9606]CAH0355732.1 hypothetical protein AQB9606_04391 [Aquabacterium sp. CECT 9606]